MNTPDDPGLPEDLRKDVTERVMKRYRMSSEEAQAVIDACNNWLRTDEHGREALQRAIRDATSTIRTMDAYMAGWRAGVTFANEATRDD